MKVLKTFLLYVFLGIVSVCAQGTLQFSSVKIVGNLPEVVPPNKVWKVTNIYGSEFRENECVDFSASSTHELRTLRCAQNWDATMSGRFFYQISTFKVNGVSIVNFVTGLPASSRTYYYGNSNCIGGNTGTASGWDCANRISDPNILPMWLPAGATLETGGPNTFVSVIEFNIIP